MGGWCFPTKVSVASTQFDVIVSAHNNMDRGTHNGYNHIT